MALRYKTANRGHQRLLACTGQSVIAIDLGSDDLALTCGRKRCQDPQVDIMPTLPAPQLRTLVHRRERPACYPGHPLTNVVILVKRNGRVWALK